MSNNDFEKRFGVTALKKGFISSEDLLFAMKVQLLEEMEQEEHRLIGAIMVELGLMTTLQVNEVLDEMGFLA
jgi:hypothetical protein